MFTFSFIHSFLTDASDPSLTQPLTHLLICSHAPRLTPVVLCYGRFAWLFLPDISFGGPQHNLLLMGLWLLDIFSYFNSTFNFFVYYAMGSRFRVTLWGLLGRKKKSMSKETAVSSGTQATES